MNQLVLLVDLENVQKFDLAKAPSHVHIKIFPR